MIQVVLHEHERPPLEARLVEPRHAVYFTVSPNGACSTPASALFVALAAFTARAIWIAWHERSGEARAEAVFDLVGQRMPPRPTEAPGAMAWLQRELERYARHLDDDRARLYRQFATASDGVPAPLERALRRDPRDRRRSRGGRPRAMAGRSSPDSADIAAEVSG